MKSIKELAEIRAREKARMSLRTAEHAHTHIEICMGTCGINAGARDVLLAFARESREQDIKDVIVRACGCGGLCRLEPMAVITTADGAKTTYVRLDAEKAARIVTEHIAGGKPVIEYTIGAAD